MVSLQNDFIDCLSIDQLHEIWKPESTVFKWNDINPDWSDNDINLYGPGTDSGTFDYFTEEVNSESRSSAGQTTPQVRTTTSWCAESRETATL